MTKTVKSLSAWLREPGLVAAPGVFDMVSLGLADSFGFDALYMTGFGTVASHLGLPDAGYGGLLNMRQTMRGYEAAGAAAIQIEDQEFPKKCGHTPGRRVIPMADMVRKIRVAVESRSSPDSVWGPTRDGRCWVAWCHGAFSVCHLSSA